MPSRKPTPRKTHSEINVEGSSGMKVSQPTSPKSHNQPYNSEKSSEQSIWANITLLLLKKDKPLGSTSDTMPVDTSASDNDSDKIHLDQSRDDADQAVARVQDILRTLSTSHSTPLRSSARTAARQRDVSTSTEDPTSSNTLSANLFHLGVEPDLFKKPMNLIEEGIELFRRLDDSFRKLGKKCQQWKATMKLREEKERKEVEKN
ncbi:hypothetical protein N7509_006013 [Penicillium cosmopolitanum]|uniref:Uncharacterized protein n=1 Tax=Penicillium cosmopolitanum TaxID=1131564 RepID=A0A9W9W3F7_9EURO|nr:uncharacterized protein N7509_006013 [Penicillium cosmopolitanum]KAJ5397900.1 hypothetical protein N7509_006013 [Penicillium cosmopolitanum]